MSKTAALVGATGLIGGYLLEELLNDPYFDKVKILIRRPFERDHPKLEKKVVDFTDADSLYVALQEVDTVFCSIGTTQRKVKGDSEAYRKIDMDIPIRVASIAKMNGCEKFILVSAIGANSRSRNFYTRLKGEIEVAIQATDIKTIHIMRPSMLLGDRKEFRPLEKFGKPLMIGLSVLLPSKWKPIHAKTVAKAMLETSKQDKAGFFVHEYRSMKNLAKKP